MRSSIVTMDVNVTSLSHTLREVFRMSQSEEGAYICVSNVHMCMETFDSEDFRQVVNRADLVIPDGRPIFWAQKLLGYRDAQQVRGQDIMNSICESSNSKRVKVGLYGGSSDAVLTSVVSSLKGKYPELEIAYAFSPPFRPLTDEEELAVIKNIRAANLDVLFVGIGCPKQELWMAKQKSKLNCVMLGVGAAFDFISGTKKHAPRWMQVAGLEWLYRLLSEPSRLWKRYLKQNPRFLYHFLIQLISLKFSNRRSNHVQ
ncbi:WecB/TagA/CpsF family glycosyltransferase [Microbulbifer sp. CAU 1566]|uniref:WecB/TagA/CpsF family glycosyltransferase n=1 Tax=Microbulbifer sp. CAU 1566 TaxID=2933269 RepID=UPI002003E441|nr:WecB/TagA/CpsF family glycosyltransferase [Microbulbifer sp. CAU 1566]MCK7598403.1 WecB/TagA/CpsF family glycosyltransferase [Microbulbifer sp. CAU 1566]